MNSLLTLPALARRLGIPISWLKAEAKAGRIPCLRAGRRMLFQGTAVEAALAERAANERAGGKAVDNAR